MLSYTLLKAIKAIELCRKGSEEETWHMEEIEKLQGLPWQPDPWNASLDFKAHVVLPMIAPFSCGEVDSRPGICRGIAVKRSESMAVGPRQGATDARPSREAIVPTNRTMLHAESSLWTTIVRAGIMRKGRYRLRSTPSTFEQSNHIAPVGEIATGP